MLSLWDRHGRTLLLRDTPAAEEGEGSRCEGKIQVTTWALQDTGGYGGGRKVSWHRAVCAEARPECGQWKWQLSKISELLPPNLELDFLMEGEEEGRGEKGRCQERLLTWQPDKRLLWLAPKAEKGRVV